MCGIREHVSTPMFAVDGDSLRLHSHCHYVILVKTTNNQLAQRLGFELKKMGYNIKMVGFEADLVPGISAWCMYKALCIPDSTEIGADFVIPLLAALLMMTLYNLANF